MPEDKNIVREGVVAVINREGCYLVIVRSENVIAPGKICFPGGGIEPNESPEEALIRECREEIGVRVRPIRQLDESVTPWRVRLAWWSAELVDDTPIVPNPKEVADILWLSVDEMLEHPDLLESNVLFLNKLKQGFEQ